MRLLYMCLFFLEKSLHGPFAYKKMRVLVVVQKAGAYKVTDKKKFELRGWGPEILRGKCFYTIL